MFKGGMAGMMQKAKQMQEDMEIVQEEIKLLTCEGFSASGSIKIVLNGEYQVTSINIADSLLSTCITCRSISPLDIALRNSESFELVT